MTVEEVAAALGIATKELKLTDRGRKLYRHVPYVAKDREHRSAGHDPCETVAWWVDNTWTTTNPFLTGDHPVAPLN